MDVSMNTILLLCILGSMEAMATLDPYPKACTGNLTIYYPCKCKKLQEANVVDLDCNAVNTIAMMDTFNRIIAEGKEISHLEIVNQNISKLPNAMFAIAKPRTITLRLQKLETLEPTVFEGSEDNLGYLRIDGGLLFDIPIDVYSSLPKLHKIYFINMKNLQVLEQKSLEKIWNIGRIGAIDLSGASISEVKNGTFTKFIGLRYLNLDGNPIGELPLGALPPQNLSSISLSNTKITRIPIELVTKMNGNGLLYLEDLGIVDIEEDTIKMAMKYGTKINLMDNPLHCGPSMCAMIEKFETTRYQYHILGVCKTPPSLLRHPLTTLRYEDINCTRTPDV